MRKFVLALAATAAAPALAQGAPAPTPQAAAPAPAPEKKICRSEPVTGSIMPGGRRVCRTKAEWSLIARARERAVDRDLGARRPSGGLTGTN